MTQTKYHLAEAETRFAELVWANAPIASGALVRLCQQQLGWKSTTTYTVLRRLCDRGLFANNDSTVTVLIDREQFWRGKGHDVVQQGFGGSLPGFVAAFLGGGRLSEAQAAELRALIDSYEEDRP